MSATKKKRKRIPLSKELKEKAFLTNREIGLRMMRLREKLGLTTTELAKKVGLSQAQISRLENGNQGFRSHTLIRISEALGVKPIYFYMDEEDLSKVAVVQESEDPYGPGIPDEVKQAMRSPRFKRFISKAARIFLSDDDSFAELASRVRRIKA